MPGPCVPNRKTDSVYLTIKYTYEFKVIVSMIQKILFSILWFFALFIIIYPRSGVLYVFITKGGAVGNLHEAYQIGLEFRQAFLRIIVTVVILITIIGTITGILPGTKKKKAGGS